MVGYWHVVMISDPTSSPRECPRPALSLHSFTDLNFTPPANVSLAFQYLLPGLFVAYTFWRFSWRYVVPAFDRSILERTIWYLGGFWVGVLINVSPISLPS